MKRLCESTLKTWLQKPRRKPLIIRGARQVGKSTVVRNFAQSEKRRLIEINLERHPLLDDVFKTGDVHKILAEIEAITGISLKQKNDDDGVLLFLDEIQAVPSSLPALRYFYEERPQLPIIAAGSLLEFVLSKHNFSMPVGRVEYLHLGPMSFKEYLIAFEEDPLLSIIENYKMLDYFPESAHQQLLTRQREFLFIGGMPEAVLTYTQTKSFIEVRSIHRSILHTYQDDFAKYAKHAELNRLHKILHVFPKIVGEKVKYSHISSEERAAPIKLAIDLLIKARLLIPVYHSHCSGLPLKAGVDDKVYKLFFADVGLLNYLCGLDWSAISRMNERELINEGSLAEQFVAQHLAYESGGLEPPELFYWLRETKSVNAEVDFVIASGKHIIPIEVKSGKGGSLKSVQQFVVNKTQKLACRFDLNPPTFQNRTYQSRQKEGLKTAQFALLSLPLYFVEEVRRIVQS